MSCNINNSLEWRELLAFRHCGRVGTGHREERSCGLQDAELVGPMPQSLGGLQLRSMQRCGEWNSQGDMMRGQPGQVAAPAQAQKPASYAKSQQQHYPLLEVLTDLLGFERKKNYKIFCYKVTYVSFELI